MKKEQSYGIIPLRFYEGQWQVLLVQHRAGHWSFPKGHAEKDEQPQDTAVREFKEETGLGIEQLLDDKPFVERYRYYLQGVQIEKTVHYFPATVYGIVKIQKSEIQSSRWLALAEAHGVVTFKEGRLLCRKIEDFLMDLTIKKREGR